MNCYFELLHRCEIRTSPTVKLIYSGAVFQGNCPSLSDIELLPSADRLLRSQAFPEQQWSADLTGAQRVVHDLLPLQ